MAFCLFPQRSTRAGTMASGISSDQAGSNRIIVMRTRCVSLSWAVTQHLDLSLKTIAFTVEFGFSVLIKWCITGHLSCLPSRTGQCCSSCFLYTLTYSKKLFHLDINGSIWGCYKQRLTASFARYKVDLWEKLNKIQFTLFLKQGSTVLTFAASWGLGVHLNVTKKHQKADLHVEL